MKTEYSGKELYEKFQELTESAGCCTMDSWDNVEFLHDEWDIFAKWFNEKLKEKQ